MDWLTTLRDNFRLRPLWMNAVMLFCAYMAFIYVPWDFLFKPMAEDEEVWFGILLTGWAAKATGHLAARPEGRDSSARFVRSPPRGADCYQAR